LFIINNYKLSFITDCMLCFAVDVNVITVYLYLKFGTVVAVKEVSALRRVLFLSWKNEQKYSDYYASTT